MQMDVNEVTEIINNSSFDDLIILEETYNELLLDLPDGPEKERFRILKTITSKRKDKLNE